MSQEPVTLTFGELKKIILELEEQQVSDDTKLFLDTGWDSLQEIAPDAIQKAAARHFTVSDPLSGELFGGHTLTEKAAKTNADGPSLPVIIIKNLY